MAARMELWLYVIQRVTAFILAPLVLLHLGVILYAIHGGLSGEEILARTQGSLGWMLIYGLFVASAGLHGAIGLRGIARELLGWRGSSLNLAAIAFAAALIWLGFRAVGAVT